MRRHAVVTVLLGCLSGCSLLYGGGLVAGDDVDGGVPDTLGDGAPSETATDASADTFVVDARADVRSDAAHFFCKMGCTPGNYCCYTVEKDICSPAPCDQDAGDFLMQAGCQSNLDCPDPSDICCVSERWPDDLPKVSECRPKGSTCAGWILCQNGGACPPSRPNCTSDSKRLRDLKDIPFQECEPDALP